jgi:hypothetical protein
VARPQGHPPAPPARPGTACFRTDRSQGAERGGCAHGWPRATNRSSGLDTVIARKAE